MVVAAHQSARGAKRGGAKQPMIDMREYLFKATMSAVTDLREATR